MKKYLFETQSRMGKPSNKANIAPIITATPPKDGVKLEWILCMPGESNNFNCVRSLISTGKIKNAIKKEMAVYKKISTIGLVCLQK